LKKLQNIEEKLGRVRTIKNGPRPIDLDILLYGDKIINNKNLQVPHPRMFERPFVMKPLLEIEPGIAERIGLGAKRKTKC
jgi:2-amino-4-hydroxy-6-hydroxymethyldihydropteridine diphosphokinase